MNALLLDYNGVVVDDEPLHFASFRDVLGREGIVLEEAAYYADYLGFDDRTAFREAFRRAGRPADPAGIGRLVTRKAAAYAALAAAGLRLVPGVTHFARAAARIARLAVVSGALRREIEMGLEQAGISDVVDTVVSAEEVGAAKPDPAGFRLAITRLAAAHGTPEWQVAVAEDSLPGLAAARTLGAGCLMLATSHPATVLSAGDLVWDSFAGRDPRSLIALMKPVAVA